jgi:LPXTG-motif cell wall-anchored protein
MRLTWTFTLTNVGAANTSQNFRFAAVNTPAANRLVANGSPGTAAYTGYAIFGNMGTPTLGNSNPFALRERVVASGAMLSAAADWGANGTANATLANGATSGNTGYANGTLYTLVWLMTRTWSGGILHDISMTGGSLDNDGAATISMTDASPNMGSFTFDTFSLRPSSATGTAQIFDTSLFRVEFIGIPELASGLTWAGICLIGSAGAVLRRRRVEAA